MPAIQRLHLELSTVNKTEKQVGTCARNSSDMSSSQPQSGNWYFGQPYVNVPRRLAISSGPVFEANGTYLRTWSGTLEIP